MQHGLFVLDIGQAVGLANAPAAEDLQVRLRPDPSTDVLEVLLPASLRADDITFLLNDATGRRQVVPWDRAGEQLLRLDVRSLAPGLHIITILNNGRAVSARFIRSGT
jgi:hypothetical protein